MRHDIWAGGRGKPGVAGWRLKPARKGSEQRSASQGKAFPYTKKNASSMSLRFLKGDAGTKSGMTCLAISAQPCGLRRSFRGTGRRSSDPCRLPFSC